MNNTKSSIAKAIHFIRAQIQWKPNSAERHLHKRKRRKHLPQEATLYDYESIIQKVLHDDFAEIYLFQYERIAYVTVVTEIDRRTWLVMFDLHGLMETAFIVERPTRYLNSSDYEYIGLLKEVLHYGP